ncbi:putative ribonuclease H-like domain-containing protein [Tanacetum coccineum]
MLKRTSQTPNSNASEEKDEDVELIVVPSAVKITEEKVESRTCSKNSKKEEILTEPQQEKKAFSTDTSEDNPKILAFRRELEEITLKHLGIVSENNSTSTPSVNTGSQTVNTGRLDPDDSPMPELEIFHKSETGIFDEASYDEEGEEPKKIFEALQDDSWVQAMQEELLQFKLQQVWVLIDLPHRMKVIGTKWVYRNKRDERGMVVRNKARLVAQGYTQEKGIDYDEVFAPVARIEAIRLFLAFASFMGFIVYQMDVKSASVWHIDEEGLWLQLLALLMPDPPKKVGRIYKVTPKTSPSQCCKEKSLSDYGGSDRDRKSTTRWLSISLDKDLFHGHIKNTDIVATSTTESEYVAACNCCRQMKAWDLQIQSFGRCYLQHSLLMGLRIQAILIPLWIQSLRIFRNKLQLVDGFREPSPAHQHFSPLQEHVQGQITLDDLLQVVPQLMTRVDSLEKDLKQTKLTMGIAIMKLVKKGRKSQDDPLVSLVQGLVTPSKTTVNTSGEEQVKDISPTTLEATKTLSRVASQKPKSIDKGRRYKRREETKGKKEGKLVLAEAIRLDTYGEEKRLKQLKIGSFRAKIEANAGEELVQRVYRIVLTGETLLEDGETGEKGVYQIVREDRTDIVYINFGAMLQDITRDDLTELYRIVMNRYGVNGPEDELRRQYPLSADGVNTPGSDENSLKLYDLIADLKGC